MEVATTITHMLLYEVVIGLFLSIFMFPDAHRQRKRSYTVCCSCKRKFGVLGIFECGIGNRDSNQVMFIKLAFLSEFLLFYCLQLT